MPPGTPVPRALVAHARALARQFPVVVVTGPRQSGKTTLCRLAWPRHAYVNLEQPDARRAAIDDPRAFLAAHPRGAILEEIQRVPDLASWLQPLVDEDRRPGRWILTGSEQIALTGRTSQSLAGRAGFARLLPLDLRELDRGRVLPASTDPPTWTPAALRGGYPAPLARRVLLGDWLDAYVESYLERDVRTLLAVADLGRFQDFVALAAGRGGQAVNLSALGADVGITHPTTRAWIGVLEATLVAYLLRPRNRSLGKRLARAPKLYWWDSGLHCHLLRVRTPEQLFAHPLRGAIFESWMVGELLKMEHHAGRRPEAYFYRDQRGTEVDLLLRRDDHWLALEFKSGATLASDALAGLHAFLDLCHGEIDGLPVHPVVVYGGDESRKLTHGEVVGWRDLPRLVPGRARERLRLHPITTRPSGSSAAYSAS
jgi:predicted AAA+ superfamily ATPase